MGDGAVTEEQWFSAKSAIEDKIKKAFIGSSTVNTLGTLLKKLDGTDKVKLADKMNPLKEKVSELFAAISVDLKDVEGGAMMRKSTVHFLKDMNKLSVSTCNMVGELAKVSGKLSPLVALDKSRVIQVHIVGCVIANVEKD